MQAVVQPPPNLHKVSLSMCTESLQDLLALPSLGLIERCPTSASPGDVRLRMSRAARAFLLLPTHEQAMGRVKCHPIAARRGGMG
jgi:hypothetical protein